MKLKFIVYCLGLFLLSSCSGSDCFKCIDQNNMEFEFCEDSGINYTDANGNVLEFDEIKPYWESQGYTCD